MSELVYELKQISALSQWVLSAYIFKNDTSFIFLDRKMPNSSLLCFPNFGMYSPHWDWYLPEIGLLTLGSAEEKQHTRKSCLDKVLVLQYYDEEGGDVYMMYRFLLKPDSESLFCFGSGCWSSFRYSAASLTHDLNRFEHTLF